MFRFHGVRRSASGKGSAAPVGRPGGGSRGHMGAQPVGWRKTRESSTQGAGRSDGLKRQGARGPRIEPRRTVTFEGLKGQAGEMGRREAKVWCLRN